MKKVNKFQKYQAKQLPQLQQLNLEELESLAGGVDKGAGTVECPACTINNN